MDRFALTKDEGEPMLRMKEEDLVDVMSTRFCVIPQIKVAGAIARHRESGDWFSPDHTVRSLCMANSLRVGRGWEVPYFFPYLALLVQKHKEVNDLGASLQKCQQELEACRRDLEVGRDADSLATAVDELQDTVRNVQRENLEMQNQLREQQEQTEKRMAAQKKEAEIRAAVRKEQEMRAVEESAAQTAAEGEGAKIEDAMRKDEKEGGKKGKKRGAAMQALANEMVGKMDLSYEDIEEEEDDEEDDDDEGPSSGAGETSEERRRRRRRRLRLRRMRRGLGPESLAEALKRLSMSAVDSDKLTASLESRAEAVNERTAHDLIPVGVTALTPTEVERLALDDDPQVWVHRTISDWFVALAPDRAKLKEMPEPTAEDLVKIRKNVEHYWQRGLVNREKLLRFSLNRAWAAGFVAFLSVAVHERGKLDKRLDNSRHYLGREIKDKGRQAVVDYLDSLQTSDKRKFGDIQAATEVLSTDDEKAKRAYMQSIARELSAKKVADLKLLLRGRSNEACHKLANMLD